MKNSSQELTEKGKEKTERLWFNLNTLSVGSIVPCGVVESLNPIQIIPWEDVWETRIDSIGFERWINIRTIQGAFSTSIDDIKFINFNNANCKCFGDVHSLR